MVLGAAEDPAAIGRRLIHENIYMTLGTADASGTPWVSPVNFAAAPFTELYWVSSPDSRHSQNLASRPEVSIVIFNSQAPIGRTQAVYMSAAAAEVPQGERNRGVEIFSRDSQSNGGCEWTLDDVGETARLRLYRAMASECFVVDNLDASRPGDRRIAVEL